MQTPSLDLPDKALVATKLEEILAQAPEEIFAVLDGGLFDNLPGELAEEGIRARSLFLHLANKDTETFGPWLVVVKDSKIRSHLAQLASSSPCAVFWSCADNTTDAAFWRHLRTINEILIPIENDEAKTVPSGTRYQRVLFRHWDPNVLTSVFPFLAPAQQARLFGPAQTIVMYAPDYGGLRFARRSADLPPPQSGPLKLIPEQIAALKQSMLNSSRLRIARYLKKHVPSHFSNIDDRFLWAATLESEKTADKLGITTERGRARWAYVMLISDGKAYRIPEVRNYIQDGLDTPDNRVKSLIGYTATALRSGVSPRRSAPL